MENEIAKTSLRAGSRTYFFDIKKASNDNLYLNITESRKVEDNNFERHNIMIWTEDIASFKEKILEIYYKYFVK